jgi:hypothetical protein
MNKSGCLTVIVAALVAAAALLFVVRENDQPVTLPPAPKMVMVEPLQYQRYPEPDGGWFKPWVRVNGTWRTRKPKCIDAPWFRTMPECRD